MSICHSLQEPQVSQVKKAVVDTVRPAYNKIADWNSKSELVGHADLLYGTLQEALRLVEVVQHPFLLQLIWRTKGQSLELAEQCFDVFVWTDAAVVGAPMIEYQPTKEIQMSRFFREVARHVRSIYDLLQTGDYDYRDIYKGMSFGLQTGKAFSFSGNRTIKFRNHKRLQSPILPSKSLHDLIVNGGELNLKPERRLGAAVQAHMANHQIAS